MKLFKYILTFLIWNVISTNIIAQNYNINNIPEELLKNSKAIVQKEEIIFNVKGEKTATEEVTFAITILNDNGVKNAEFVKFYNNFTKIRNIKATIYDKNGIKVKKIPWNKIQDYSAISGFSLYEDNRIKYIDPNYRIYPFTIEYSYKIKHKGLLNYPTWQPYKDYNVAVINSKFKLILNKEITARFYANNIDIKPKINNNGNINTIYTWQLSNLKSLEKESFSEHKSAYIPTLFIAPTYFSIDGYKGNAESWENFGKWILQLNEGKNQLPEETQKKIKELVKDCENKYDSVATIYKYMQDKSRYVSIQEGIGSWQPFDAETVDRLSYGDCKALANYTKSLLDIVNIKSNYVLIRAGEDAPNIKKEFPSNQFNHAILCVPDQKDTIWLECTNPFAPADYLGSFTDDRDALLIDENGSIIVHTPAYSIDENLKSRNTELIINNNGNGKAKINTKYTGYFYDQIFPITKIDDKDKKEQIYKNIKFANFEIKELSYNVEKNRLPVLKETLNLDVRECATRMGNMLLVDVTSLNKIDKIPPRLEERKSNIYIKRPTTEIDTISILYPENYVIEAIPNNISIHEEFGDYSLEFYPQNGKVICIRKLIVNKGNYEPKKYDDFVNFYKKLYQADNSKLVLKEI